MRALIATLPWIAVLWLVPGCYSSATYRVRPDLADVLERLPPEDYARTAVAARRCSDGRRVDVWLDAVQLPGEPVHGALQVKAGRSNPLLTASLLTGMGAVALGGLAAFFLGTESIDLLPAFLGLSFAGIGTGVAVGSGVFLIIGLTNRPQEVDRDEAGLRYIGPGSPRMEPSASAAPRAISSPKVGSLLLRF